MRRLMLLAICGLLLLASATPASAGWGHIGGWHHGLHHGWHHGWHGRSYAHYLHRPYHHHYHAYRHHYRSYVPRYYAYPSFSFSYRYAPAAYYYYPSRYYVAPYCASTTPTYYEPYSLSLAGRSSSPTLGTVAARPKFDSSPLAKLASRLISEVATGRTAYDSPAASRTLGAAPATTPRARAMALVEKGDEYFRAEQYSYALAYYEAATKMDADCAEADFRQGLCGIATGRYDKAAQALRRGVAVDPSFLSSTFRLKQIYKNEDVRTQHVEALAGAALENSNDPQAYFLIGAFLHFEGTPDRAGKFLQRASELAGDGGSHAREFLAASRRSQPLVMTSGLSSDKPQGAY